MGGGGGGRLPCVFKIKRLLNLSGLVPAASRRFICPSKHHSKDI